ncbi:transposase [Streptomyces sp. NPDC005706]|uniref:transposase n=1 Tax=Streptomyces sp. NPDC005706 TaxID=3157169 RepID=UPI0033C24BD6
MDDFAFRKGRHYGTVLINMATHRPLHLFDGREGEDLAAWLRDHPEVKVICRDRSSGYGEGARIGAPQAEQVAERYHVGPTPARPLRGQRPSLPHGRAASRQPPAHQRRSPRWSSHRGS